MSDMLNPQDPLAREIDVASQAAAIMAKTFEHSRLHARIACETHAAIKGPNVLFTCAHCVPGGQDQDKPVGIILMPKNYCICVECLHLWERGKFKFMTELQANCWYCVKDEADRLRAIKPTLFMDLYADPKDTKIILGG